MASHRFCSNRMLALYILLCFIFSAIYQIEINGKQIVKISSPPAMDENDVDDGDDNDDQALNGKTLERDKSWQHFYNKEQHLSVHENAYKFNNNKQEKVENNATFEPQLSYMSEKMRKLQQERVEMFQNFKMVPLTLDDSNWKALDFLAPYNFDLCMRQYSREFYADPILNSSTRNYPVPLSIFSRGSTIHVTLSGVSQGTFKYYATWLNDYVWKVKTNELWSVCTIIKGKGKRADGKQRYFLLNCENTHISRLIST